MPIVVSLGAAGATGGNNRKSDRPNTRGAAGKGSLANEGKGKRKSGVPEGGDQGTSSSNEGLKKKKKIRAKDVAPDYESLFSSPKDCT